MTEKDTDSTESSQVPDRAQQEAEDDEEIAATQTATASEVDEDTAATVSTPKANDKTGPTALSLYKPKKPKFGGTVRIGADTWAVWTGGKPNSSWTELEEVPSAIQPNQYRPTGIASQAKSQAHMSARLTVLVNHRTRSL